MDVRNDTSASNGGLDEGVELLVSSDGKKQVSWCDTFDLQVLACVTGELKHLGSEVLHDGGSVDRSSGSDTLV